MLAVLLLAVSLSSASCAFTIAAQPEILSRPPFTLRRALPAVLLARRKAAAEKEDDDFDYEAAEEQASDSESSKWKARPHSTTTIRRSNVGT